MPQAGKGQLPYRPAKNLLSVMLYSELASNAISDGMVSFASKEGSASEPRLVRMPYDTRPSSVQDRRLLKTTFTISVDCPLSV